MDVPSIGKAKGLFEIFIPGVFLLLNFVWMLYCIIYSSSGTNPNILESAEENEILMLVLITVFGYLTGAILYLGDADFPDKLSAMLRGFWRRFRHAPDEAFYNEDFPYIKSLGSIVNDCLPGKAYSFYRDCWERRNSYPKNKYFFNYCKCLINSVDEKSAIENYSSEALIMYLAAMFYALVISIFLLLLVVLFFINTIKTWVSHGLNWIIHEGSSTVLSSDYRIIYSSILIIVYVGSIFFLLWHFRYMRFKEVQTVFTASLINREFIETCLKEDSVCEHIYE
jgi:hypothetical protein